jgi:hypothetical protein
MWNLILRQSRWRGQCGICADVHGRYAGLPPWTRRFPISEERLTGHGRPCLSGYQVNPDPAPIALPSRIRILGRIHALNASPIPFPVPLLRTAHVARIRPNRIEYLFCGLALYHDGQLPIPGGRRLTVSHGLASKDLVTALLKRPPRAERVSGESQRSKTTRSKDSHCTLTHIILSIRRGNGHCDR